MALLTRKRLILLKKETTYGTDASPAATDAVLVRDLSVTPMQSDVVSRDLVRSYLGASEQLLANTRVQCQFTVELASSGVSGQAPRFGAALQACGLSELITASAVTGSAQAGTTNSITLAAGASATDNAYLGMYITITSGTGNGHAGVITAYVGSTKVATVAPITTTFVPGASSAYSITANANYRPISSTSSSATIYYNIDGILHSITGARGTFTIDTSVGAIPSIQFTMTGIYNAPSDTPAPAGITYSNQATPLIFKQGNTTGFRFFNYAGCVQSFSFDIGNTIVYRELVNCTKEALLTARSSSGSVSMEVAALGTYNPFTAALTDGTTGAVSFMHGTADTNRFLFLAPRLDLADPSYTDTDGIAMYNLPFTAVPSSTGNDEFVLTFA